MKTTLAAIFLVAIVATTAGASSLEGRLLKDDAEGYPVDDADYDLSGDDEEWPEGFLERGEPSEVYLQEVREQLENRSIPQTEPLTRFRRHTIPAISHESTIVLQYVYISNRWVSCWWQPCRPLTCPGLYFGGHDWGTCLGEQFHIYRALGPGTVRVGDLVGIYYPHGNTWLGCAGFDSHCGRSSCPGQPSTAYGFQNEEKWYQCVGEVFKIYANGKSLGAAIQQHDHVTLFYLFEQKWFSMLGDRTHVRTCLGTVRPPPSHEYESCLGEVFEIWQKPMDS